MRIPFLGVCMLVAVTLAGCSSSVALMRDDTGGFRQERYYYACEDDQLCGASRSYDVNWQRCYDYPVAYRVKSYNYTPSGTQYLYQRRIVVADPYYNFYWRGYDWRGYE
ncbi:MAG: hypothetical protein NTW71_07540 [Deltaproteobacteria bacterium]|nr:hypothetical protein [Deltaproteobacteria bacterium]